MLRKHLIIILDPFQIDIRDGNGIFLEKLKKDCWKHRVYRIEATLQSEMVDLKLIDMTKDFSRNVQLLIFSKSVLSVVFIHAPETPTHPLTENSVNFF